MTAFDNLPPPRKGCDCEEHARIYDDWPIQDAELIIGTCMRECPYCRYGTKLASHLRSHIRTWHDKRNLLVQTHPMGARNIVPGWQALPPLVTTTSETHSTNSDTRA